MREQMNPGGAVARECGSWPSPITLDHLVENVVRLGEPSVDGDRVFWIETRPNEGGRSVLVGNRSGGDNEDVTPESFSVRSRAHEYGGGSYLLKGDRLWFINDSDQCIYSMSLSAKSPRRLTQPGTRRFAQMCLDEKRERLIMVCEDHAGDGEAKNSVVTIDLDSGAIKNLIEGADFYSDPRLSPDGQHLAWLSWNHPNLPWDTTELWLASVDDDGELSDSRCVSLGSDESVFCPRWSPGGQLFFVSDRSGWWNLYRHSGDETIAINKEQAECGMPQWVFGMCTYGFADADTVFVACSHDGTWRLYRVQLSSGQSERIAQRWTTIDNLAIGFEQGLMIAGSPAQPLSAIRFDKEGQEQVLSTAIQDKPDPAFISVPQAISYPTSDGDVAHGFYYPPTNPGFCVAEGKAPPLLVSCHGGPTSATVTTIKLDVQFWTTRGFAVLDVNYRGSTGYGRAYRQKLYGAWGIADVEDCVHGARFLVDQGKADANRLAIRGGSAGGFTVLAALAFRDTFTAGASFYGIGDLKKMFATTHKFEASYDYWLLGPREQLESLHRERSPILHASDISCPVIFFQGLEDKVVPPDQSRSMVKALDDNGIPVAYIEFEGEGHGFRRSQNIRRQYEAELNFYARVMGFVPVDDLEPVEIRNLN